MQAHGGCSDIVYVAVHNAITARRESGTCREPAYDRLELVNPSSSTCRDG